MTRMIALALTATFILCACGNTKTEPPATKEATREAPAPSEDSKPSEAPREERTKQESDAPPDIDAVPDVELEARYDKEANRTITPKNAAKVVEIIAKELEADIAAGK